MSVASHQSAGTIKSSGLRSIGSHHSLITSIISGGNLENISLSPQRSIADQKFPVDEEARRSPFDFNLSQEEFDDLVGSQQSLLSGDTSIQRLPPLKPSVSYREKTMLPSPEPIKRKSDKVKVIGYAPLHAVEFNPLSSVEQPRSKFEYHSKSLARLPAAVDVDGKLGHQSLSKVSLLLSDSVDSGSDGLPEQMISQHSYGPKFAGKFLSRVDGFASVQPERSITSINNLQAHSTIEHMESVLSLQSDLIHSQELVPVQRVGSAKDKQRPRTSSRPDIAIPTVRARTPKAQPDLEADADNARQFVEVSVQPSAEVASEITHTMSKHLPLSDRVVKGKSPARPRKEPHTKTDRVAYVLSSAERSAQRDERVLSKLKPILQASSATSTDQPVPPSSGELGPEGSLDVAPVGAFIPHRKILGWKLTSVQKRKELIELLDLLSHPNGAPDGKSRSHSPVRGGSPPVGRKRQILLSQLEEAMHSEIHATSPAYVNSSSALFDEEEFDPEMVAQDKAQFERVYFRQSLAYENFLERSLQTRVSYKNQVGIAQIMAERKAVQQIAKSAAELDKKGMKAIRRNKRPKNVLSQSNLNGDSVDSTKILQLTMETFDENAHAVVDRPMSRLLVSRSALRSKPSSEGGKRAVTPSQVLYDFPYSIHKPLDRMDIIKSVQTRALLKPLVGGDGLAAARELFSREASQLISSTMGRDAKPHAPNDDLLQEYLNSENDLLRMLSRDQDVTSSELHDILGGEAHDGASAATEDDQLVEAFIEGRYKVGRLKKKQQGGRLLDEDDASVGNRSMSSLGDQSAALYDLILPTAAAPPPLMFVDSIADSGTPVVQRSVSKASVRGIADDPSDLGMGDAVDDGIASPASSIPVNPW